LSPLPSKSHPDDSVQNVLYGMAAKARFHPNATPRQRTELLPADGHNQALSEISSWPEYQPTPLISLQGLANFASVQKLWYKDEGARFGLGSFKALGGAYAVLRLLQRRLESLLGRKVSAGELRSGQLAPLVQGITVTTATDGNHGRSVAWGAKLFGCQCQVYVPSTCSEGRETAIRQFGASVTRTSVGYDETVLQCTREADLHGHLVVSDTSWADYTEIPSDVMQGYTVMIAEAFEQMANEPPPTHVFVQCGVGGLAAAVSVFLMDRFGADAPALIVVEPEHAACMYASAVAGKPTLAPDPVHTVMAGLDCGQISLLAWEVLSCGAAGFMTVPDESAAICMWLLANAPYGDPPITAGESGVAGLAALLLTASRPDLRSAIGLDSNSRVLVFGTEGATDPDVYAALIRTVESAAGG
jgi:diaminopropionate ammonia-lyase